MDLELHGAQIPGGSRIFVLVGAANQDPDAFGRPRDFNIDREAAVMRQARRPPRLEFEWDVA